MKRSRRHLVVTFLGAASLAAAAPAAAAFRCDSTTTLTLVGVDTRARQALFAAPAAGGDAGWLVEADFKSGAARGWSEAPPPARFAGSSGPGPVLAATRCGDKCLQVVRFRDGGWQPLGEPLLASDTTTLHLTWDRTDTPWMVLHSRDASGVAATAYRLESGDWVSKGALSVRAVGNPGASPAPPGEEGVVSGDGRFTAAGKPRRYVQALPKLAGAEAGQLLWLGGAAAVHMGADGLLRATADGGAGWEVVHWQPLTPGQGALAWRPGKDYWIELPEGERGPPLAAIWNDRRNPDEGQLFFASQSSAGAWRVMLSTPEGILTQGGERLPYNHVFRFGDEGWAMVTGCVARQGGAALAIRRFAGGKLGAPELLPIALP